MDVEEYKGYNISRDDMGIMYKISVSTGRLPDAVKGRYTHLKDCYWAIDNYLTAKEEKQDGKTVRSGRTKHLRRGANNGRKPANVS